MTRGFEERARDVSRLLDAARSVYARREELVPDLVATTGLSREGVLLGFESLERDASDDELDAFVRSAGEARHVHVILSANVFVAPLRAIAFARAAASRVTVRPSTRDPVLARAVVHAAGDPDVRIDDERDPAALDADRIDVYGRAATIDAVRARARPGVLVSAHGPGFGAAFVTRAAEVQAAARALAPDVVAFDQRGCLSPRIALVEGESARADAFAAALHASLSEWDERVPRGTLDDDERADARRWHESLAFAGRLWTGAGHAVGVAERLLLPPPGRHVQVVAVPDPASARALLEPIAATLVSVGTDDAERAGIFAPAHARIAALGRMQRPPLDGPVDRRAQAKYR